MGWDLNISIEEYNNGSWNKINSIDIAYSRKGVLHLINDLDSIATSKGIDEMPPNLSADTLKAMEYHLELEQEGCIDLGDMRIIYWYEH